MNGMGGQKRQESSQPLISVDVVPIWTDNTRLKFGLGTRQYEPFKGALALPGVLMGHERSLEAALRALTSKVGIGSPTLLRDIGVFDSTERDPRGPTLSIAKIAVLDPTHAAQACQAGTMHAMLLREITQKSLEPREAVLPFDHESIVSQAHERLSETLWGDPALAKAILGESFTTREATSILRDLTGDTTMHPSNVRRRLSALDGLEMSEDVVSDGRGRPSNAWHWLTPWGQ